MSCESPASPDAGLSLALDTAQEPHQNRRVAQHLFAEVLMTEIDDVSEVDLQGLRDFVVRNEVVSGGDELYAIVAELWPELLYKVKPPRSLMH